VLKCSEGAYGITRLEEVRHGLNSQVKAGISKRGRDMYRDNSIFLRHLNETEHRGSFCKDSMSPLERKKVEEHWFRSHTDWGWGGGR